MKRVKRSKRLSLYACSGLVVSLLCLIAPKAAQAASCSWTQFGTPSRLSSISAIAASDILAGGPSSAPGSTQIAHWDGTQWSLISVPSKNGPSPANVVSATADDDIWVLATYTKRSGKNQAYILHYDGTNWSEQLLGLADASAPLGLALKAFAPNDVWAVQFMGDITSGSYVSWHWNGSSWAMVPFKQPIVHGARSNVFEINGIGGTSGSDLWAVGRVFGSRPLIEHFDGRRWLIDLPPTPGPAIDLNGVFASSPNDAWIVGNIWDHKLLDRFHQPTARTYAIHWNGQTWSAVTTPNFDWPSENLDQFLLGAGGSSSSDAWAVGYVGNVFGVGELTLHWDGRSWSVAERPTQMGGGYLSAVAELAPNDVWGVGTNAEFWCARSR